MTILAAVRSITELKRARLDLSAFMSHFAQEYMFDRLSAVCIDEDFAAEPPGCLIAEDRHFRVSKSAGLPHIWQLCWLEDISQKPDLAPTRQDIFRALLAAVPGSSGRKSAGSLIPVVPNTSNLGELETEIHALWAIGGERLLPPWFQTAAGSLEPSGYTLADLGIDP